MDFVTYEDEITEKLKLLVRIRIEFEKSKPKAEGENREIFKYEFFDIDEYGLIGLQMYFYEKARVFLSFQEVGVIIPENLVFKFIDSGIKTIFTFDQKTNIEFN